MKRTTPLVVVAFVAVSLIWGSTYLGIRVALESFPPFMLGSIRFLAAGAILFVVARLRAEPLPRAIEWRSAAVTGFLFFVIGNGLVNVAEKSVSSGLASVLVATMPLWAILICRLLGERASALQLGGTLLGLGGVAIMNLGGELRASPGGTCAALLAPIGWALGSIASKRLTLPGTTLMRTAAQMLTGGAAMLVVSSWLGESMPAAPSTPAIAAVVYLAVFGSVIGFSAYVYLLENVRASVATSYAYINPVIAVVIGITWAGERIDLAAAIGAVVVVAAVLLVARSRARASTARARTRLVTPPAACDSERWLKLKNT